MDTIHNLLLKYWNHNTFREPQEEIINAVIKNNDVFTLLPTGAGKSLCFQIPALIKSGICIVISPLIALMEDQVNSLQKRGIKAIALTSRYNIEDTIKAFDNLRYGNYKFLYLSPEKLQSQFIQDKISQLKVNLIAVDEAHCISQWGHDFRPAYLKISILKELHPQVNIIALTASATPKVMTDIVKNLELKNVQIFKKSFSRKNLIYSVLKVENTQDKLEKVLLSYDDNPVIIYTNTRKNCIDISRKLNYIGYKSSFYHGGLQNDEKLTAFNNWMEEKTPIMVATNAFGMGIDKNNVRAVIHMNIPNSIENYLQEVGRAGRDGIKSFAILIYNDNTIFECQDFLDKGIATPQFHKEVYNKLNQYYQVTNGELPSKTYTFNLYDFCSKYDLMFLKTYHVLNNLDIENIIEIEKNANKKSNLKIIVSNSYLFKYEEKNKNLYKTLKIILRSYGGVFEQFININEGLIAKKMNISKTKVIESLTQLAADKVIIYKRNTEDVQLKFLVPREDNFVIHNISRNIVQKNKMKIEKINAITDYVKNNKVCRNIQLLEYFKEKNIEACGICNVCRSLYEGNLRIDIEEIAEDIISVIENNNKLTFEELEDQLSHDRKYIIKAMRLLIDSLTVRLNSKNKIELIKNE